MPMTHYPNNFKNGVSIKDIPIDIRVAGDANVFWVDSNTGSDGNKGTFQAPFATIDYTVGRCSANNGDIIYVAAGHTETVIEAEGLALDIAGITIIFLGEGSDCGTITFTTAVTASCAVKAANITLINPRFVAGIDALTGPISIGAANCKIINGEWYDAAAIAVTDCIVADSNATGLIIDGWKYTPSTTGTQKQSNIQLNGVDNAILKDIDINGDFATGNIENITDEVLNIRFENVKLINENATPKPGIVLDANSTGYAKNVDIRIASGTVYVSNVAKLNWDNSCLGYNTDGAGGDPIGTGAATGLEGKIDAIQADLGDPSARTNFQNIEDMIGIPDAANSSLDDILRSGFDSSAITQNAQGAILERLEYLQQQIIPDVSGLVFSGTCDTGMTGSTTTIVCAHLAGYTDDIFNTKYYMQVIKNANSVGNAPETEVRQITDYVSATGTFTVTAFSVNVEEEDKILVIHESLITLGRDDNNNTIATTNVVANADGSVLERQEYTQGVADTLNTNIGDPSGDTLTTITAKLGNSANAIADQADTLNTNIGDPSGDTLTTITAKLGDSANAIADQADKIDSAALTAAPTANSLAAFIASGGTALGTELADSKSVIDALGSDGTTLAYGSGSMLGAIGTEFWVKKTLISSNITQAGVDVTGTSSGGELSICQIVLKTDATGLAGGTNKVVYCDNTNGEPDILAEAVGNLGANATVTLETASVSGVETVLESGKKIIMRSTVADGTGAGTVDVYLKCQRLAAGATISAA